MSKLDISFSAAAWSDYLYWQKADKKTLVRINRLLEDIGRDPLAGIGKPEPLRENLSGYWSRRITDEHRLVYFVTEESVAVVSCRYHYSA